jgi:hypothetical protein
MGETEIGSGVRVGKFSAFLTKKSVCMTIMSYLKLSNFIKKIGLFWLMVLKVQGQRTTCGDDLVSRVLRWCRISHGKRWGACSVHSGPFPSS